MSKMKRFVDPVNLNAVQGWFKQFGHTSDDYLRDNFGRFVSTQIFAYHGLPEGQSLTILDVGAHWLHQAFLYANDGHQLICVDSPNTYKLQSVIAAAKAMGARLEPAIRLEKAEGFSNIPDDSIDLLLFCEILEHLAFNPIPMWKEIYRVMKPGCRMIITTPNSYFGAKLQKKIDYILSGKGFGLPVEEIISTGTYGHHWKEFSPSEIRKYFEILTPDFVPGRLELHVTRPWGPYKLGELATTLSKNVNTEADTMYFELKIPTKTHGIAISPPWDIA